MKLDADIEKIRSYIDDPGNNKMFMLESRNMQKKTGQKTLQKCSKTIYDYFVSKGFLILSYIVQTMQSLVTLACTGGHMSYERTEQSTNYLIIDLHTQPQQ